ncbi:MAG: PIN domain-containing protein [Candidatus Kapaibacterium sp.]|nr:MAG: PIN domain-containing protein [Candidatus Kapabacteria bacterium]
MTLYYLDSSAWLQYYVREQGSERVAALFQSSVALACSSFGFVEVVVTLSRLAHSGAISHEDLLQKIHDLENDWTQFLQVSASSAVIKHAEQSALKYNLSPERALHIASLLAVQERTGASDNTVTLVSTDTELLVTAQKYGIPGMNPSEAS